MTSGRVISGIGGHPFLDLYTVYFVIVVLLIIFFYNLYFRGQASIIKSSFSSRKVVVKSSRKLIEIMTDLLYKLGIPITVVTLGLLRPELLHFFRK